MIFPTANQGLDTPQIIAHDIGSYHIPLNLHRLWNLKVFMVLYSMKILNGCFWRVCLVGWCPGTLWEIGNPLATIDGSSDGNQEPQIPSFTGCVFRFYVGDETLASYMRDFCCFKSHELYFGSRFESHDILMVHMGVSKNSGTPKWMVYKGKPY